MAEPLDAVVRFPGGLRARLRWGGSGQAEAVFALTEAGGVLQDHGAIVGAEPDRLCRAELRVDAPGATWTARLASAIHDRPRAVYWDTAALLVVGYGFHTYGFAARSGELRWSHRSHSPIVEILGSARLDHVIVQAEVETFAIEADGTVAWRAAHSDVVAGAELLGGRLILTSYGGLLSVLDPATGRAAG